MLTKFKDLGKKSWNLYGKTLNSQSTPLHMTSTQHNSYIGSDHVSLKKKERKEKKILGFQNTFLGNKIQPRTVSHIKLIRPENKFLDKVCYENNCARVSMFCTKINPDLMSFFSQTFKLSSWFSGKKKLNASLCKHRHPSHHSFLSPNYLHILSLPRAMSPLCWHPSTQLYHPVVSYHLGRQTLTV